MNHDAQKISPRPGGHAGVHYRNRHQLTSGMDHLQGEHVLSEIEFLAMNYVAHTERRETWLLSAGFWDPVRFWNALVHHRLGVPDFLIPNHRCVAAALLAPARLAIRPTVDSVKHVSDDLGAIWRSGGVCDIRRLLFTTSGDSLIGRFAVLVRESVDRRRRALELLDEAELLLGSDLWTVRQTMNTHAPHVRVDVDEPLSRRHHHRSVTFTVKAATR